jgi:hypothetical protein
VTTQIPYQAAARVFWIVDGGGGIIPILSQRACAVGTPMLQQFPCPCMPGCTWPFSHGSNQIELYFSIVQRKVLTPLDVTDEAAF